MRINIYRRQNGDNVTKNVTIETNERKLIALIAENPTITQAKLAEELDVTTRTIKRILSKWQEEGLVRREGTNRNGRWIIEGFIPYGYLENAFTAINQDFVNYIEKWVDVRYYNAYAFRPYEFLDDKAELTRAIQESDAKNDENSRGSQN